MANIGTLWTIDEQPQGRRIRAAIAFAGLSVTVPKDYVHYTDNKKPEFLSKFPFGKIPALETTDGFRLAESTAIARYVSSLAPNSTLLGSSNQEAALVDQFVSVADTEIGVYTNLVTGICRGFLVPYSKPMHTAWTERQISTLKTIEEQLRTRTYLVGERITLADITLASVLQRAFERTLDAPTRAQFPNTLRHFATIVNHPKMSEIFGSTAFAEKAIAYTPPPKEKKEPTKPAAAPAPKAEKKPKAKEADDDDDDDDNLVPEEPKAKNPLDSLPKSDFNLEDWKRAYSNMDTRGPNGALEWFYEKFDKEGFSIWRVDFKYNNELTQVFMSSNQIGGFFNRLEGSRKYLFGSVGVLGKANDSVITGVLILRGKDYKPVVDVAPDWESYTYKAINLEDDADKKFFEASLAWDLEENGKSWADGKNFK